MLKVTVITPSYNQGKYLEQTIQSVLSQNWAHLEYIIIDGGSQDDSVEIIRKYEKQISYWTSEEDNGQSGAINKGLKLATGDIITWLNSDDQFVPGALQDVVNEFEKHPGVDVVHGKTILFGRGISETIRGAKHNSLPQAYLAGMAFPQPSSFFSRRILNKIGSLDESLHYGMDYDFFVRIYLVSEFVQVESIFSKYRLHPKSKSMKDHAKFAQEWAKIFSKVMVSSPGSGEVISHLIHLNCFVPCEARYVTSKTFDSTFLTKSFLQFVLFQITFYYQAGEFEEVRKFIAYARKVSPEFFLENELNKVYWRARLLPWKLVMILRNL